MLIVLDRDRGFGGNAGSGTSFQTCGICHCNRRSLFPIHTRSSWFHLSRSHMSKLPISQREADLTNMNYGGRPTIYQGALDVPYPSPPYPRFVSCERLPPPQPLRRTWTEVVVEVCDYVTRVFIGIFILEIALYGYFKTPGSTSSITGQLTHYEILGIDYGADQDAITDAWREQLTYLHPDTVQEGNIQEMREQYYWIQLAYVELSDPLARCYHDQYHGFVPRKFGENDPCTKILRERERDGRRPSTKSAEDYRNELFSRMEKDYGLPVNWLKPTKNEAGKSREGRSFWKQLGELAKKFVAWPLFILLGLILTLTELSIVHIVQLAQRHGWRRRVVQFLESL